MEGLWRAPHDYRPSIEIFPDLDVDKVTAEFRLEEEAKKRAGASSGKPSDDSGMTLKPGLLSELNQTRSMRTIFCRMRCVPTMSGLPLSKSRGALARLK